MEKAENALTSQYEQIKEKGENLAIAMMRGRIETAAAYYRGELVGSSMPKEFINRQNLIILAAIIAENECSGYDCKFCQKPWYKIEFDSPHYGGEYHVPGCECYHRCPVCGLLLYEEYYRGDLMRSDYHCSKCNFQLLQKASDGGKSRVSTWRKSEIFGTLKEEVQDRKKAYLLKKYGEKFLKELEDKSGQARESWRLVNGMIVSPESDLFKFRLTKSAEGPVINGIK